MKCNICGGGAFADVRDRKAVRCTNCGSLERTRLLWMYLEGSNVLGRGKKVLHFAPEKGLADRIRSSVGNDCYSPVDLNPEIYHGVAGVRRFDITKDLESIDDESFDLVLHIHVLEHVPCSIAYVLFHIHRILDRNGLHVFSIPVFRGSWDECFDANVSREERIRRFGQDDHVRKFGMDDIGNTIGKIVDMTGLLSFDARRDFSAEQLTENNIPAYLWSSPQNAPIMLCKNDYLLR